MILSAKMLDVMRMVILVSKTKTQGRSKKCLFILLHTMCVRF